MRNRIISFLLAISLLLSLFPSITLRAEAVSMWFAPAVQAVTEEIHYNDYWSSSNKYRCRGALYDYDDDGLEELILTYIDSNTSFYPNLFVQVWDVREGNPVCVMEYSTYADCMKNEKVYFSEFDGKEYLVIYTYSGGNHAGSGSWVFLDPTDSFEKKHTLSWVWNHYDAESEGSYFDQQKIEDARYDEIVEIIQSGTPLNDTGTGIFSFEQLTAMEMSSQLLAYSDHHDLSFEVGDVFEIRCILQENGYEKADWQKPSFVTGNGQVISVTGCEKLSSGYLITVEAVGAGSSSLTVVESDSGAFVTVNISVRESDERPHSYLISNVPEGYVDVLGDRETLTNFYNFNGLYMNNYKYSYLGNGKYKVSFDIYNQSNMYGGVDIYDKSGKWIGCERIEKFKDPTSIYETGENTLLLLKDTFTLNLFSYTANTVSEKTSVQVEVPAGGYIVVSNNYFESPGTYLYNSVDYMILSANLILKTLINSTHLKDIQDKVVDVLTDNDAFLEAFLNEFSKISVNTITDMTNDGIANSVGALTAHAGDFFEGIDLDFWGIVSSVTNIGEEIFLAATMAEVAVAMKSMFALNESLNYLFQARDILRSGSKPYIVLYTQAASYSGGTTISGVTVTPEPNSVPADAVLQVYRIADDELLQIPSLDLDAEHYKLYNICYTVENEEVQPDGKVTVQLPIPQEFDSRKCVVLHQQEDGGWKPVIFTVRDGYAVFSVDHFSLFALVQMDRANPFEDVQFFLWYTEPVLWAVEKGITTGLSATSFAPDAPCTRGQVVTFLWRAAGCPAPTSQTHSFTDVKPGDFYYDAVLWAVEKGITTGLSVTSFGPNEICNRGQVATFLHRYAGTPAHSGSNPFDDVKEGDFFYNPALWAVEAGITNGYGSNSIYAPDAQCTRGQIVTFLYRAIA